MAKQWPRFMACACLLGFICHGAAGAAEPAFTFAVIGNVPTSAAQQPDASRILASIDQEPGIAFIVDNGNLKGPHERCGDDLLLGRKALLDSATLPLIYVPGVDDWVDCALSQAGGFDPIERLDFIRENFFDASSAPDATALRLTRESDTSRFSQYRENVRWEDGPILFVGLDVPGGNNHFSDAGGRNGEFEERTIANAFWLRHSLEYAKRRRMKAIVVIIQGNPDFARDTRRESFAWLHFTRRRPRDGYLEFKRDLFKLAENFAGPILLIHDGAARAQAGFHIDRPFAQPLNRSFIHPSGAKEKVKHASANLTRVEIFPGPRADGWIQIRVSPTRMPMFSVSEQHVPVRLSVAPSLPDLATSAASVPAPSPSLPTLPAMPQLLPLPPASDSAPELPGLQPR